MASLVDSDQSFDSEMSEDSQEAIYRSKKYIMIGSDHQAQIPEGCTKYDDALPYENEDKLLWNPTYLSNQRVEEYLTKCQDISGIIDANRSSLNRLIRDDEEALHLLLQCGYNIEEALRRRSMMGTPLPSDTMSLWSEIECRNFENGLKMHGKNFSMIQKTKVKTRSIGELIQFYYIWKKTERYDIIFYKLKQEKKKLIAKAMDVMDQFIEEQEVGEQKVPESKMESSPALSPASTSSCSSPQKERIIRCLIYGDKKKRNKMSKMDRVVAASKESNDMELEDAGEGTSCSHFYGADEFSHPGPSNMKLSDSDDDFE